jgi:Putative zinc-finger
MAPGRHCMWKNDSIERYSLGTLPDQDSARLEEHLLVCEACRDHLAKEDAFAYAMRHAALQFCRESLGPDHRAWLFSRLILTLSCASIALLLAVTGWQWVSPHASASAWAVKLEAIRGAAPGTQAPAGHPLALQADLTGLPAASSYRMELVDRDGREIWKGSTANATVDRLRPGMYFLRVYSTAGDLLREYGLEIKATSRP